MGTVNFPEVKDVLLFELFREYFTVYLPTQKGYSAHTVKSYLWTMNAFLDFVKAKKNVELAGITFAMIDHKLLAAFLSDIDETGASVATRNLRLTAIRSFYTYCATMEPLTVAYCDEIGKVPYKKSAAIKGVEYMSEAAVSAILAQPDATTLKGLRDQLLLLMFYDTGARISEVLGVQLRDMKFGEEPTVSLRSENTKNKKPRSIPLSEKTVALYQNYCNVYHPNELPYSQQLLFYTIQHGHKNPIGETTVRDMITCT